MNDAVLHWKDPLSRAGLGADAGPVGSIELEDEVGGVIAQSETIITWGCCNDGGSWGPMTFGCCY